jgi:enterochelin esterase family protein
VPTPTILDNLRADGRIPPVVAVFVSQVDRARELACNEDFGAFVATELIPWAQERYHAGKTASDVVVAGSSFGGLAAAFVALRHPRVIGNVLSQSGNFAWAPDRIVGPNLDATTEGGWLIKEYIGRPSEPVRFYLDAGVFEADRFAAGDAILESTRHFRDVLRAKGLYRNVPPVHRRPRLPQLARHSRRRIDRADRHTQFAVSWQGGGPPSLNCHCSLLD